MGNALQQSGLDPRQLRARVIVPVLGYLQLTGGEAAIQLLLGTAAQESGLRELAQSPAGPALGLFQIEPATHDDIWHNFLTFRPILAKRVTDFVAPAPDRTLQLASNLAYATAICRVKYARTEEPLPPAGDVDALAHYWKRHYNTADGAGSVAEFVSNFRRLIGDLA
jgi:hypothetical protein